ALHLINAQGADALMLVLPADHSIENGAAFASAVHEAARLAQDGYLVTFGIPASSPETGYGYIKAGNSLSDGSAASYTVARFIEKPDVATARSYVESGDYSWNSGIFLFTAGRFLEELQEHRPDIYEAVVQAWNKRSEDLDFIRPSS